VPRLGRCGATAGGRVVTRQPVVAKATAGQVQDDKQQDQNEGEDPKHLYPAWYAGVTVQVSHVPLLRHAGRQALIRNGRSLSRHSVSFKS